MLEIDGKTHLLHQPRRRYELQDVAEPNLFEEIFRYDEVPKVPFSGRLVPMSPAAEMVITDTTFRDGQQARPPYAVKQIVDLYDMLHRLGGPRGIIRQSEFFLYSDKDRQAVEKCLEKGHRYPEVTGWIRAVKEDFALVKQMGLKETGILTSCSDYHIFLKLRTTRRKAMEKYLEIVRASVENGIVCRCHLEDLTRADFQGFVLPFVQELTSLSEQSGVPIKVRLCDTMGYGVPWPGAALPRGIPEMVHTLIHEAGVPGERLEWHGHNDFHKVLINASTAWLYGCAAANGTLLGFGERTGNPPVEGLVIEYAALRGTTDGMDTSVITEIAQFFEREIGVAIPDNYPLVGRNFNVTSAGIHADGALKSERIYNVFDTAKLLNRPLSVNVTDKSGIAGIAFWVNSHLRARGLEEIDKRHPALVAMHEWVEAQYREKRTTAISNEEMLALAARHLPEYFESTDRETARV